MDDNRSKSCEKSKKKSHRHQKELQLNVRPDASMELILTKILQKFKIENATWNQKNEMFSVMFSLPSGGAFHEHILKLFKYWGKILSYRYLISLTQKLQKFNEKCLGIGERPGSSVTMLPCTVIMPTKSSEEGEDEVFGEV